MKTVLFGGSGFLGSHLLSQLLGSGHNVTLVTRRPDKVRSEISPTVTIVPWTPAEGIAGTIDGSDAIINLSGESIGERRWSAKRKDEILSSRIDTTRAIVDAIGNASKKPTVLLNASAVGYYGNVENDEVTETYPAGTDFLAGVCQRWENEAMKAEQLGIRVVLPRTGVVLAKNGGALERMILPFKLFAGGPLGSGKQWFPWIHIEDEIRGMIHLLEDEKLSGPVNLTAPGPVTMKQFCSALGKAMHRPSWAPVPAFILKTVLGEMADALVLGGQKVLPKKLLESGFRFRYAHVNQALADIFS